MGETTAIDMLQKCIKLKIEKSADYQGSKWKEEEYFPFEHKSYMHMIHTKYLRMRSVVETKNPNFESLEDTLRDLAVYACMYAAWIENQKEDK